MTQTIRFGLGAAVLGFVLAFAGVAFASHTVTTGTVLNSITGPLTVGQIVAYSGSVTGLSGGSPLRPPNNSPVQLQYRVEGCEPDDGWSTIDNTTLGSGMPNGTDSRDFSDSFVAPSPGTYGFRAFYPSSTSGNHTWSSSVSLCQSVTVNKLTPTVTTEIHDSSEAVIPVGGEALDLSVHDSATVSGSGPTPTGTVDFVFYNNGSCTAPGTDAGTGIGLVSGVAHPSNTVVLTSAGSYSFKAFYSGDSNYESAESACENFTLTTIEIGKEVAAGGADGTFGFSITGPTASTPGITTSGGLGSTGLIPVLAGGYTIAEDAPTGYILTASICDAGFIANSATPSLSWSGTLSAGGSVTCTFENTESQKTRSQGFWKTHPGFAGTTWGFIDPVDKNFCSPPKVVDNIAKVMGGFWANNAQKSTGNGPAHRRTALDQARMSMLNQLLAAMLNVKAFGANDGGAISAAKTAYCGTNVNAIKNATNALTVFNEIGGGVYTGVAADPRGARAIADIPFWDSTI